jgi:hypothetical protein
MSEQRRSIWQSFALVLSIVLLGASAMAVVGALASESSSLAEPCPGGSPSDDPSGSPSASPTADPSSSPSASPTADPSASPSPTSSAGSPSPSSTDDGGLPIPTDLPTIPVAPRQAQASETPDDDCPSPRPSSSDDPSPTPSHSPDPGPDKFGSQTTIKHNDDRNVFKGSVNSARGKCEKGRVVQLRKERPGQDKVLDRDRSNADGFWKLRHGIEEGQVYGFAKRKSFIAGDGTVVVCKSDRSRSIHP